MLYIFLFYHRQTDWKWSNELFIFLKQCVCFVHICIVPLKALIRSLGAYLFTFTVVKNSLFWYYPPSATSTALYLEKSVPPFHPLLGIDAIYNITSTSPILKRWYFNLGSLCICWLWWGSFTKEIDDSRLACLLCKILFLSEGRRISPCALFGNP